MKKQSHQIKEASHRMLLELAVDAFFQGDTGGNLIMVNNKAVELSGYTRNELLTMNLRDLFSDDMMQQSPLRYDRLEAGETVKSERDLLRKDGSIVRVEMNSKKMPDDTYQSFIRDISQRTLTEKALAASELRYRKLHESMIDGFVYTNMAGDILDSNASYGQMLGYTVDELASKSYLDLTPGKWHDFEMDIVQNQIITIGHSTVYEKEYIRKDGTIFPVELRTFLVRDDQGNPEGMWAIVRDITQRKLTDERLRNSEEKFRSIIESSPTAMHFYHIDQDQQLILTGANPSADRILGINHGDLVGKNIIQAFPNLAETHIPKLYLSVAKGGIGPQSFEIAYEEPRFSGFFFVHVFRTHPGSITVDFIDITERKEMENALMRSEIEYRDTLDSLLDWIFVVDKEFRVVMVNASLSEAMAKSQKDVNRVGLDQVSDLPFFNHEDISVIDEVFRTGAIAVRRQKIALAPRAIFAEITIVPLRKDGEVVKAIVVIRDRSREKEIEELKQRNADQKEVMLREIHHRVKNNLAIVISLLTFQLNDNDNPDLKRALVDIQTRIRAMALIHEHLYRSENLDRIPLASYLISLGQMIISTFSGRHITLINDLEPIETTIETALPAGLIINELLTNAYKYAFTGMDSGEVTIRLTQREGDYCQVSVSDNGIGLPDGYSMDSSTSLGLYIVRLLTEQIDGTLNIDRRKGTTFTIRFRNLFRKLR